jgi:hypothetical protein
MGRKDGQAWISVKDRLPELWDDYLAFGYGPTIPASCFVAVYDPKSNKWYDMHTDWDWSDVITHWMPLPEPPEKEYQFTARDMLIFEKPEEEK